MKKNTLKHLHHLKLRLRLFFFLNNLEPSNLISKSDFDVSFQIYRV